MKAYTITIEYSVGTDKPDWTVTAVAHRYQETRNIGSDSDIRTLLNKVADGIETDY